VCNFCLGYYAAYIKAAGIAEDKKGLLFRKDKGFSLKEFKVFNWGREKMIT
jgi:hypothetical protein